MRFGGHRPDDAIRAGICLGQIRVNDLNGILRAKGCPYFDGGTFGGDAGGTDNGKDHIWRYYDPNGMTVECLYGRG